MKREGSKISSATKICSDHILEQYIDRSCIRTTLKPGAKPTRLKKVPGHFVEVMEKVDKISAEQTSIKQESIDCESDDMVAQPNIKYPLQLSVADKANSSKHTPSSSTSSKSSKSKSRKPKETEFQRKKNNLSTIVKWLSVRQLNLSGAFN